MDTITIDQLIDSVIETMEKYPEDWIILNKNSGSLRHPNSDIVVYYGKFMHRTRVTDKYGSGPIIPLNRAQKRKLKKVAKFTYFKKIEQEQTYIKVEAAGHFYEKIEPYTEAGKIAEGL